MSIARLEAVSVVHTVRPGFFADTAIDKRGAVRARAQRVVSRA
jgi:hypothetical protein